MDNEGGSDSQWVDRYWVSPDDLFTCPFCRQTQKIMKFLKVNCLDLQETRIQRMFLERIELTLIKIREKMHILCSRYFTQIRVSLLQRFHKCGPQFAHDESDVMAVSAICASLQLRPVDGLHQIHALLHHVHDFHLAPLAAAAATSGHNRRMCCCCSLKPPY